MYSRMLAHIAIDTILKYGNDILTSKAMQCTKRNRHHGNISVYEHSVNVTFVAVLFSLIHPSYKIDMKSLVRGALLHDYYLYCWHDRSKGHRMHGFVHARKALENASKEYSLNEIEKNMIDTHMFPLNLRVPRYRESRVLTLSDKLVSIKELLHISLVAKYTMLQSLYDLN